MNDSTSRSDVRGYRRRLVLLGALPPVAIMLASVVVIVAWLPDLPAQVAQHWSVAGRADGYGPALAPALVSAAVVLVLVIGVVASSWTPVDAPRARSSRVLLAAAWFASGLLSIIQIGTLAPQLDGRAESAQQLPVGALVGSLLGGLLLAVIGWLAAPRGPEPVEGSDADADVPSLNLSAGRRAVWTGSTHASLWLIVSLIVAAAGLLIFAIVAAASGDATAWALALPVVVLVAAASTLSWHVRLDSRGVLVRSFIGVPRYSIPLSELDDVTVVPVSPVGDFGGWGLRFGAGRTGIVMRTGAGLQFDRATGRSLVVTIDDAEQAAGVGRALLEQARIAH